MIVTRPRFIVAATLVLLLAGCAAQEEPVPVSKTIGIVAGSQINEYNEASNPVVLRLYQLSNRTEFEEAGFWDLFNGNDENLAGVTISNQSIGPIYPGEHRVVPFDLLPNSRYLGVFAEFADYENQEFGTLVPVDDAVLEAGVSVQISSSGISISAGGGGDILSEDTEQKGFLPGIFSKLFGGGS